MVKLLHAEELARLAGVHKSTVLLAIRRGELRASRTAGRSARIAPEDARGYLRSRNKPIPVELEARGGITQVAVLTESAEIVALVRQAMPEGTELLGDAGLYGSLIAVGASVPAAVVIDLDMNFMNPVTLLRALRGSPTLRSARFLAVGLRDDLFGAARSAGAEVAVVKVDQKGLSETLQRIVSEAAAQAN